MTERRVPRKIKQDGLANPVKPGTPLHRLLQLIAQEVAKTLQEELSSKVQRPSVKRSQLAVPMQGSGLGLLQKRKPLGHPEDTLTET